MEAESNCPTINTRNDTAPIVSPMPAKSMRSVTADLDGIRRLSTDAVTFTTRLVEASHTRFDWFSNMMFPNNRGTDRHPVAGWVYDSIHAVNDVVGTSLDLVLLQIEPMLGESPSSPMRETGLAVLNGVIGDYLQKEQNPLTIHMQFRVDGIPQTDEMLTQRIRQSNGRLLVLVHGSCSNDLQWLQEGHDHGAALANALDMTPIYLHYNTGLHISENGKLFASQLNRLVGLSERSLSLYIVSHSMGGLVSRSACHYAETHMERYNSKSWLDQLKKLVFLGTPHHGALLERGGKWVDYLLALHPKSEPFSWLGKIRSKGVTDLGYGNVRDEDWLDQTGTNDCRQPTPLPKDVQCYAIAAVSSANSNNFQDNIIGDGLVTEASALGKGHQDPNLNLSIPSSQQKTIRNTNHIGLLSSKDVYKVIHSFLKD